MRESRVAGVDGCRHGWLAVVLEGGRFAEALLEKRFATLRDRLGKVAAVGVDIPVGLSSRGVREADVAAEKLLGPRRASVFRTPPRDVVQHTDYAEANALSRALQEQGISKQAFHLFPRIREVDSIAAEDERLYEVHPEVSFALLHGAPMSHAKKTWTGMGQRRALLESAGVIIPADIGDAGKAATDDVLDAAAAAWSARRIARGEARAFPDSVQVDPTSGRRIAIWG